MPRSGNNEKQKSGERETGVLPTKQFLIFKIDDEEFGVEILDLQEIIRFREITAVPHAGKDVEGVLSLRGKIVTVISGRKRLERKEKKNIGVEKIIVKKCDEELRGLIVDDVVQVLRIPADKVEPAPPPKKQKEPDYVQELISTGDRMISVLEGNKLFDVSQYTEQ